MNKKLVVIALSAATLFSGVALGLDLDPKFYVGAEADYNHHKGEKKGDLKNKSKTPITDVKSKSLLEGSHPGAGVFVGTRLSENFGVEAGASMANKKIKNSRLNTGLGKSSLKTKNHNLYVDAMGYLPVEGDVDLIGSLGAGQLTSKVTGNVAGTALAAAETVSLKSKKVGLRVGAGAQYKFNENVGARIMLRHQKGNKLVKNVNSAGLGLFCQF